MTAAQVIERACQIVNSNIHCPQFARLEIVGKIRELASAQEEAPPPQAEAEG